MHRYDMSCQESAVLYGPNKVGQLLSSPQFQFSLRLQQELQDLNLFYHGLSVLDSKASRVIFTCSVSRNQYAGFLYFKPGVFRVGSCGKSFSYLRAEEMLIDTDRYEKVFPDSCFVGSCSGNVRTTNVWCFHHGDVENEI